MAKTHLACLTLLYAMGLQAQTYYQMYLHTGFKYLDSYIVLDTVKSIVTYDLTLCEDLSEPTKVARDIITLQVGRQRAVTYSENLYQADSISTEMKHSGSNIAKVHPGYTQRGVLYRDYPKGKITTVYRMFLYGTPLKYTEDIPRMSWELADKERVILGYRCKQAFVKYRGRDYEAWYAPDIPIFLGPWKFAGLPGLILELYDQQRQFVYTCTSIANPIQDTPLRYWKWRCKSTTRDKARATIRYMHKHPNQYAIADYGYGIAIQEGGDPESIIIRYTPIELE